MIVLGLTGSIGMGKSRVAAMLRILGIPVHDSDREVHRALKRRGASHRAVAAAFPSTVSLVTGEIDRRKLGDIVFSDPAKRRTLEAILHPAARAGQVRFVRAMQRRGKRVVALEIPLLFETGAQDRVDHVLCVSAPPAIQRRRVMARPGMTQEKFEKILSSQIADADKRAMSDFIVQTGLGQAHTFSQLRKIVKAINA